MANRGKPERGARVESAFVSRGSVRPRWLGRGAIVGSLLLVGLFALGHALWAGALHPLDDCTYAAIARNILDRGEWLPLWYDGVPFYAHGPLVPWITAGLFRVFGVSEAVARLPSVLFGVGTVLVAFSAARRATPERLREATGEPVPGLDPSLFAGLAAGLVLLGTEPFLRFAGRARLDAPLAFFVLLAIYCFVRGVREDRRWFVASGVAVGLAVSTKGVVGLLPLPAALAGLLVTRAWAHFKSGWLWLGALASVLVPAPWILYLLYYDAQGYWGRYVVGFIAEAVATGRGMQEQPWWFYLRVLATDYWPWLPLALLGLWRAARESVRGRSAPVLLYAVFVAIGLAALSVPATKYPHYLLPLYPVLAVVAGVELSRLCRSTRWRRRIVVGWYLLAAAAVVIFAFVPLRMHRSALGASFRFLAPEIARRLPSAVRIRHVGLDPWEVIAGLGFYARRLARRAPSTIGEAHKWLTTTAYPVLISRRVFSGTRLLKGVALPCAAHGDLLLLCRRNAASGAPAPRP